MTALSEYLKIKKKSASEFGLEIGIKSRATSMRVVNGQRFRGIQKLFLAIYEQTRLTPNDILGFPPRKDGGDA